jgi:predicted SAM-dependent methyltransferase
MELQRVSNAAVHDTLLNWRNVLKVGGELHIMVPSLEWMAREILNEDPSPMMLVHIFGVQSTPEDFWLSGYTMRRLRVDMEDAGFAVEAAKVGYYTMNISGQEHTAETHYVLGRKTDADKVQKSS